MFLHFLPGLRPHTRGQMAGWLGSQCFLGEVPLERAKTDKLQRFQGPPKSSALSPGGLCCSLFPESCSGTSKKNQRRPPLLLWGLKPNPSLTEPWGALTALASPGCNGAGQGGPVGLAEMDALCLLRILHYQFTRALGELLANEERKILQ